MLTAQSSLDRNTKCRDISSPHTECVSLVNVEPSCRAQRISTVVLGLSVTSVPLSIDDTRTSITALERVSCGYHYIFISGTVCHTDPVLCAYVPKKRELQSEICASVPGRVLGELQARGYLRCSHRAAGLVAYLGEGREEKQKEMRDLGSVLITDMRVLILTE